MYLGDVSTVRKISPGDWLTTPAGSGAIGGFPGDGGPAARALVVIACGVAVDSSGNLVIADAGEHSIRVVAARTGTFYGQAMTAGDIYSVAGNGLDGFGGDGGPARLAELGIPDGVAVDQAGNLVIADSGNGRVRVVAVRTGTFHGQAMTAGDIYTVAGGGTSGLGDGGPATAAAFFSPRFVTTDAAGNVVISDEGHNRVRLVAASSGTFYGQAMTAGDVYTIAGDGTSGFAGDGAPATSAELSAPGGVAVDGAGNLLIADIANGRVRVVPAQTGSLYGQAMTAGDIYTIAGVGAQGFSGDHGPATRAKLDYPGSVTIDAHGNPVIAGTRSSLVRVVSASTGSFYGQPMTAGDIYTIAGDGTAGFSGDRGPATAAQLNLPGGTSIDRAGDLVIADTGNQRVRLVAARTGTFYGHAMTAGDIFTIADDGTAGFSGDGGRGAAAELNSPAGLGVDPAGNVLISDFFNGRVRVVAARTGAFYGQAMTAGHIYTIAGGGRSGLGDGGSATRAELAGPAAVTFDGSGNLLIADSLHDRVRVVAARTGTFYGQAMTAGHIYTIAGTTTAGFTGDGGAAVQAELDTPSGVAVEATGAVLIADTQNGRIRIVTG